MVRTCGLWAALLGIALGGGGWLPATAATPSCTAATGPQVPGCTFATVFGDIRPNALNSPGEPVSQYLVQDKTYGFSHAEDEAAWRGKYHSGAHASASLGVLRTTAAVSGRYEEDILDRPRVANARGQATAWYYDRITITVAGAAIGQDAVIHGSLLARGGYAQVFDNLKGPLEGYTLTPKGLFAFSLGASQFPAASIGSGGSDLGMLSLRADFNSGAFGYTTSASHSLESGQWENLTLDPFAAPLDFAIRFKSGVPFYLQALANLNVILEMTGFDKVQPLGSVADLEGLFGESFYWNGLSDAKVGGELRAFSVTSASGVDWATSMAPVPEPGTWLMLLAGLGLLGARRLRPLA